MIQDILFAVDGSLHELRLTVCAEVQDLLLELSKVRPSGSRGPAESGGRRTAELQDAEVTEAYLRRGRCQQL